RLAQPDSLRSADEDGQVDPAARLLPHHPSYGSRTERDFHPSNPVPCPAHTWRASCRPHPTSPPR
ncbi:MAG: hypothetical protein ACFFCW_40390, partial [Candidatus Hodarchaeota archaeon]